MGLIMTQSNYRFLVRASDRNFHFILDRHAHRCILVSYLTYSVNDVTFINGIIGSCGSQRLADSFGMIFVSAFDMR